MEPIIGNEDTSAIPILQQFEEVDVDKDTENTVNETNVFGYVNEIVEHEIAELDIVHIEL